MPRIKYCQCVEVNNGVFQALLRASEKCNERGQVEK